jgi:hypothetical protein
MSWAYEHGVLLNLVWTGGGTEGAAQETGSALSYELRHRRPLQRSRTDICCCNSYINCTDVGLSDRDLYKKNSSRYYETRLQGWHHRPRELMGIARRTLSGPVSRGPAVLLACGSPADAGPSGIGRGHTLIGEHPLLCLNAGNNCLSSGTCSNMY